MKRSRMYVPIVLVFLVGLWAFYPAGASGLAPGTRAPEFAGGPWLGSNPLKIADLRGKVILLDMWTFG